METHIITLAWFDPHCSPNAKVHNGVKVNYRTKAEARKIARQLGKIAAYHTPKPPTKGNIPLTILFYPKGKQGDLDNCLASIKGHLDGIADALKIDDKRFRPITIDFAEIEPLGKIEVILTYP